MHLCWVTIWLTVLIPGSSEAGSLPSKSHARKLAQTPSLFWFSSLNLKALKTSDFPITSPRSQLERQRQKWFIPLLEFWISNDLDRTVLYSWKYFHQCFLFLKPFLTHDTNVFFFQRAIICPGTVSVDVSVNRSGRGERNERIFICDVAAEKKMQSIPCVILDWKGTLFCFLRNKEAWSIHKDNTVLHIPCEGPSGSKHSVCRCKDNYWNLPL